MNTVVNTITSTTMFGVLYTTLAWMSAAAAHQELLLASVSVDPLELIPLAILMMDKNVVNNTGAQQENAFMTKRLVVLTLETIMLDTNSMLTPMMKSIAAQLLEIQLPKPCTTL